MQHLSCTAGIRLANESDKANDFQFYATLYPELLQRYEKYFTKLIILQGCPVYMPTKECQEVKEFNEECRDFFT